MRKLACIFWLTSGCSLLNQVDPARIKVELCGDGLDNDESGRSDCRDAACFADPRCATEASLDTCTDGRDNEPNGRYDCEEPSCAAWPPCQEDGAVACADGVDNDRDGHTDCDDARCGPLPSCVLRAAWAPEPRCPKLRPGTNFSEEWEAIDANRWSVFSTGARDRPRLVDGALDPHGDNFWSSGVATTQKLTVGQNQNFRLEAEIRAQAGCDRPAPSGATCLVSIGLDTREEWGDGLPFGVSLFGLYAQVLPSGQGQGPRLMVIANYHPEPSLPPLAVVELPWTPDQRYRLAMAGDPERGEVVFSVDEVEVARATLLPREPPGRLVLHNQLDRPSGPGVMLVERVEVAIEDERPIPDCRGRSRDQSLLPTAYCEPNAFYDTGLLQPSIAFTQDQYLLLFTGSYRLNRTANGLARSRDGLEFEHLVGTPGPGAPRDLLAFTGNFEVTRGSLWAEEETGRLLAWHYHFGPNDPVEGWLSEAQAKAPTDWRKLGPLSTDGPMPLGPDGQPHPPTVVAEGSVVARGGRFLAYYSFAPEAGRTAVFALESQDGLHFHAASTEPVLRPTPGGFDADAIRAVAAAPLGSGVLLAYLGVSFADGPGIGLAYAEDGLHFEKHPAGALLRPDPEDLTALGMSGLTLRVEGAQLRLWVLGQVAGVECPQANLSVPIRGLLGHFALQAVDR